MFLFMKQKCCWFWFHATSFKPEGAPCILFSSMSRKKYVLRLYLFSKLDSSYSALLFIFPNSLSESRACCISHNEQNMYSVSSLGKLLLSFLSEVMLLFDIMGVKS